MSAVCILPAYGAQCYGDIGFQSFTGALILGVAVGVAGKVSAWADSASETSGRRGIVRSVRVTAAAPLRHERPAPALAFAPRERVG
jgi:hypothetical protein